MIGRTPLRVAVLVAVLALPVGCVRLPTDGPVVEVSGQGEGQQGVPGTIVPKGPQPGEDPQELVTHFVESMEAFPVSTRVARQFLADNAPPWDPSRRMITYTGRGTPVSSVRGTELSMELYGANWIDERGRWRGPLPSAGNRVRFPLVQEGEEWRVGQAPDALLVGEAWLGSHYERLNVYFYDPSGRVLIPEPVFVPVGGQSPTALVAALLRGPAPQERGVSRTFLPDVETTGLSVPVSDDGVAEINLDGDASAISADDGERMLAQLAWTLRGVDSVRAFRLTIGGVPIVDEGLDAQVSVYYGKGVAPASEASEEPLFAVRDGRVVTGRIDALDFIQGPLGHEDSPYKLRSVAGSSQDSLVAGVTAGGGTVVTSEVYDFAADAEIEVTATGTDFLEPAWDFADNLWLLDRTARGARVLVVRNGRPREVRVPGVTGRDVRNFLVSRDGSRLVAVRSGKRGEELVVSRLRHSDRGRADSATTARVLDVGATTDLTRIRDIGWRSPTSVLVLYAQDELTSQVRLVSLDGSPVGSTGQTQWSPAPTTKWLVSSPVSLEAAYVIQSGDAVVLTEPAERHPLDDLNPGSLTYGG